MSPSILPRSPQRPLTPLFLVSLIVATTLAGCLGDDTAPTSDATTGDEAFDLLPATGTTDLDALVIPDITSLPDLGAWTREWIKDYAQTYHNRISFTPVNDAANQYLKDELDALGYETRIIEYGPEAIGDSPVTYKVIEGVRKGTVEPDRHIGLIAHHDARYSSNEAAYDDASGTGAVLALAKHFAEVDTRKSVVVLFFDGEEMGLRSSCYYANDVARGEAPRYDIAFGYDMVGINAPGYHVWDLYVMMGDEDDVPHLLMPMAEEVLRERAGYPEDGDGLTLLPVHDRNSDERRFREIGLPIYRWAGGRHADDYPHYHEPTDTYDNMIAYAGGEESFENGINAVIQSSILMLHAADQYAFEDYVLTEQECGFAYRDDAPIRTI